MCHEELFGHKKKEVATEKEKLTIEATRIKE
jgi:hypothetical protein